MKRQIETTPAVGLIAPFFTFACILVAVASWPKFSWINNALSDLGVQSGLTALVFNSGLIIGGIMFAIFAVGLLVFEGKRALDKVASLFLILASISIICIGIFNESFKPTHYIVSVMLFTFLPISMLVYVGAFWLEGKSRLSVFTLVLGLFAAAVWALQLTVHYVPGVAIPEFASGLAGAVWVFVLSFLMLKKSTQLTNSRV